MMRQWRWPNDSEGDNEQLYIAAVASDPLQQNMGEVERAHVLEHVSFCSWHVYLDLAQQSINWEEHTNVSTNAENDWIISGGHWTTSWWSQRTEVGDTCGRWGDIGGVKDDVDSAGDTSSDNDALILSDQRKKNLGHCTCRAGLYQWLEYRDGGSERTSLSAFLTDSGSDSVYPWTYIPPN